MSTGSAATDGESGRGGGGGAVAFEEQLARLFGLAYRMLGSTHDAEDVVQDAYLRWSGADRGGIDSPPAWLTTVVAHLCLNQLTSARARRETYVGPWLPEPVLTPDPALGPADTPELRDSVSMALLVAMERLNPAERAVYVLREAFGYSHRDVAGIVKLSEANCRQPHSRARRRIDEQPPAPLPTEGPATGARAARRRPVPGEHHRRALHRRAAVEFAQVNGAPGVLAWTGDHLSPQCLPSSPTASALSRSGEPHGQSC